MAFGDWLRDRGWWGGWRRPDPAELALLQLLTVAETKALAAHLEWARSWLSGRGAIEKVSATTLHRFLAAWIRERPGYEAAVLPIVDQAMRQRPEDARLFALASPLLRNSGRFTDALAAAEQAHRLGPGYESQAVLAGAHRALGHVDEAGAIFREMAESHPGDHACWLDVGDTLLGARRASEAIAAYQRILAAEPRHEWAYPSMLLARYRAEHDEADACINVLRRIREEGTELSPGDSLSLSVSGLEAPSARLALALELARDGRGVTLEYSVKAITTPDPRLPDPSAKWVLWAYDGIEPRARFGPPTSDVRDSVAALARGFSRPCDGAEATRSPAHRRTPSDLPSLLGVMVHPPEPPADLEYWTWLQRVQVVAALEIAAFETRWPGERRREALFSLALGPNDWAVSAAIIALTTIAFEEPVAAREIRDLFVKVRRRLPEEGYCCWAHALASSWLRLPGLDEAERQRLLGWVAELEAEDATALRWPGSPAGTS